MRLLWASGSAELGKVASGSVRQGLWLGDRKVESQIIGKYQSRFPGKERLEKLGENDEEEELATEGGTGLGLDLGEKERLVVGKSGAGFCFSLKSHCYFKKCNYSRKIFIVTPS